MFYACARDDYGTEYHAIEDSIGACITSIEEKSGEPINTLDVDWYLAEPIELHISYSYEKIMKE